MTKQEMAEVLTKLQEKESFLREEGQKEYAHDDQDAFANFNRVAASLGIDRKQVCLVYMLKHLDGITSYIKGHKSQREPIEGRILDLRVYLALLAGMIEEEEKEEEEEEERRKRGIVVKGNKLL